MAWTGGEATLDRLGAAAGGWYGVAAGEAEAAARRGADFDLKVSGKSFHPSVCSLYLGGGGGPGGGGAGAGAVRR